MDYIRFAIANPVKVTVAVLLLILFGFISLMAIPVQLIPNVDQPVITIETNWVGRSPQEVEREIIEEQEEKLKAVGNLEKMIATASEGRGEITLEFNIGTDMSRALQEVSDKLREVPSYPEGVDEPVVTAADGANENAIAWMLLQSEDPDFNMEGFYDFADKRIKPYLERTPGLSRVNVYGGRERELQVQVNPRLMAQRGITFDQLRTALQRQNVSISAGQLAEGRQDIRVRVPEQFGDQNGGEEQIRNAIITATAGGPITVGDIAEVKLTLEKRRRLVRANGRPALAMNAIRETGSNVMEVMEELRHRLEVVNTEILPSYNNDAHVIRVQQVYDETEYIEDAINVVYVNLIVGGTLAGLSLLLFLRTLRPTMIVAITIPISVIGTFVVMTAAGRNLNVISLAGLAFAVGMVVDNAIVVLENIDRHLHMGKSPWKAAYDATQEVWGAILASTLTTLAVFVPVLVMEEEAGQLFRDIALAICAAVTLSLIVSVTVIPSASSRWLREVKEPTGVRAAFKSLFGLTPLLSKLAHGFASLIHAASARNVVGVAVRVVVITGFTLASLLGVYLLAPPATYLPSGNQNLIFAIMFTPPSYNMPQNENIGKRVEQTVRPFWEADSYEEAAKAPPVINFATGEPYENVPPVKHYFFVSFGGTIFMGAASEDKENVAPIEGILNNAMMSIPGSFGFAKQRSIFGGGMAGSNAIDVEIFGTDLDELRMAADAMYNAFAGEFGYPAIRPDPLNFNLPGPELQVTLDQFKAKETGLDASSLGIAVATLVDGVVVGDYRYENDAIDLRLVRHPDIPLTPDLLDETPLAVQLPTGPSTVVPLSSVAQFRHTEAPQQINRIEQLRAITLTVAPPGDVPLEAAQTRVGEIVNNLRQGGQIAPDIEIAMAGSADKLTQVRQSMIGQWKGWNVGSIFSLASGRFFLALLITYLLMAALFESFLYPLVIMFAVPLSTVGGFMGLAIMHAFNPAQQLDVLTMLGFVILVGVVVNNAILLVHQALNFMRGMGESGEVEAQAMAPREAIRESVRTRIRPIFMTTTTSVIGMLPLVVIPGSGTELYRGLGSVMLGGLIVATVFTLIVVPLLFSLVLDAKLLIARTFGLDASELATLEGMHGGAAVAMRPGHEDSDTLTEEAHRRGHHDDEDSQQPEASPGEAQAADESSTTDKETSRVESEPSADNQPDEEDSKDKPV